MSEIEALADVIRNIISDRRPVSEMLQLLAEVERENKQLLLNHPETVAVLREQLRKQLGM